MKILVIDRDALVSQMIATRLEGEGHEVVVEAMKNEGLERVGADNFDIIFIDPAPMKDARAMVLNIRRAARNYPYIFLLSTDEGIKIEDAVQMGCNDFIAKPLDGEDLHLKVTNAKRLNDMFENLGDTQEDFPSAGGVISKSAFNQLCLSAMERGGRYNELAFILSIYVEDYKDIKSLDGAYVADYIVSKMAHHMVRLRRLSDIIGQIGKDEYAILLQRADDMSEGIEAAKRFAATFDEINDFLPPEAKRATLRVRLTHLPSGATPFDYGLTKTNA